MKFNYFSSHFWRSKLGIVLAVVALSGAPPVRGQTDDLPTSFHHPDALPLSAIQLKRLPRVDVGQLMAQDAEFESVHTPYRIGVDQKAGFSTTNSGTWESLPGGARLWRLQVECPGALWVMAGFGSFRLPPGARLWVYAPGYGDIQGSYGIENVREHGQRWTYAIQGETAVVELFWPASLTGQTPNIHLGTMIHGYRLEFPEVDDCGEECEPDSGCPLGLGIDDVKRGVVRVNVMVDFPDCDLKGMAMCSGSMVNNTGHSCTQYLLTAGHCVSHPGLTPSSSVLFNYERADCCEGSVHEDDILTKTGMTHIAEWDGLGGPIDDPCFPVELPGTDHALLRVDDDIPSSWDVYVNGWDRSGSSAGQTGTVHQPAGAKSRKVSVHFGGFDEHSDTFWRVPEWDIGKIRSGSSGGPLFTGVGAPHPGLVTGVLTRGHSNACVGGSDDGDPCTDDASCDGGTCEPVCPAGNGTFGRFDATWNGGGTPNTRLKDWLDPANTNLIAYPGREHIISVTCSRKPWLDWITSGVGGGGGDDAPDPGETFTLRVTLENKGTDRLANVAGTLSTTTPGVTILDADAVWPDIPGLGVSESLPPHFTVRLDADIPCGTPIEFTLASTAAGGDGAWFPEFTTWVGTQSDERLPDLGTFVSQSLEGGNPWTRITADDTPLGPRWFIGDVAARSHTALTTPAIASVPANATLRYRQKYDTENIYGGGVLEYRLNGGVWTDADSFITRGQYLSGISGEVASVMRGRAAWSGDSDGWHDVEVDLSTFVGETVAFRWVFATDDSGADVGWWVDDAVIDYLTFACATGCASTAACPDADVNCDNLADGFDIAVVRNSANWLKATADADEPRADVNGDGLVDGFDVAVIRNSACWLQ